MSNEMHESISSEGYDDDNQGFSPELAAEGHTSVSSDTGGTKRLETIEMEEESTGAPEADAEDVEGFDLKYALNEGMGEETVKISKEMEQLAEAGAGEFVTPESVCGRDNRIRISRTTSFPWRAICQLIITRADGARVRCTGWFIGPRTVMTAGHCLFSRSAGGWARQIEVIPGMDAARRPYGSQIATSYRSVLGWIRDGNPEYDYGCIIMPNSNLGSRTGWFGFASLSTASLQNLLVNNSGYPADKPFGTQWFNAGRITRVTTRRLQYLIDTFGGQSGSPVWRYRNGRRHAVGIHGYGGCPNKAVRINSPVFNNMRNWKYLR